MRSLEQIQELFRVPLTSQDELFRLPHQDQSHTHEQSIKVFSKKWQHHSKTDQTAKDAFIERQIKWHLDLYGFADEDAYRVFLKSKRVILDAGCGQGEKTAWLAQLAPHALVIGMDHADFVAVPARRFKQIENLVYVQGDIAHTGLADGVVDFILCDQVIHHTEDPAATFAELVRVMSPTGVFACYVYAKKALPRELLDDYFREKSLELDEETLMAFSQQMAKLGKTLDALNAEIQVEDIPLLNIKGGTYSIQRFIYWNFLKCFWNEELGWDNSVLTNYDWYGPSQAFRYSKEAFLEMAERCGVYPEFTRSEPACHTARFVFTPAQVS